MKVIHIEVRRQLVALLRQGLSTLRTGYENSRSDQKDAAIRNQTYIKNSIHKNSDELQLLHRVLPWLGAPYYWDRLYLPLTAE